MRGCMCWDVDVYTKAWEGQGWRGEAARAEKNCRAGKRQAQRGMFESVGKRESDQLGTNVRERGLGGVTGLPRYLYTRRPQSLRPNTSLSRARGVPSSGAFTRHFMLSNRFQLACSRLYHVRSLGGPLGIDEARSHHSSMAVKPGASRQDTKFAGRYKLPGQRGSLSDDSRFTPA